MSVKYFLILFICYLPVYLALVFYLRTKIQGYNMHAHMVSYLSHSAEPWRSVFNVSTILYGVLSFALPVSLNIMLGTNQLVALGSASLIGAGAATVLVGFFPMDRRIRIHNIAGFTAFLSALVTGIVFSAIFHQGMLFFPPMQFVNLAVVTTMMLLGFSLLLRKQNSSFIEWLAFLCTIAWNLLLSVLLLTRMD